MLVSEIMLQQTTVAAVIPHHERFLARFPSFEALAAAEEEEVLAAWSGLGYYRRARNLKATARAVVTDSGGIQEETTVLGVRCLTVRDNTERPSTIDEGTNVLVGADPRGLSALST